MIEKDSLNVFRPKSPGTKLLSRNSFSLDSYWPTRTPSLLVAIQYSDTVINLTWLDGVDNAKGIRIYISTDEVNFVAKGIVAFGDEAYSATGLTPDTMYYFYAVAYKGIHESPPSNTDSDYTAYVPSGDAHLSLEYTNRSGLDLLETYSGSSLNAKIIPSVGKLQSTDYIYHAINNFQSSDTTGYVEARFYFDGSNSIHELFSSAAEAATARYFRVYMSNKILYLKMQQNITTVFTNTIRTSATFTAGWYTMRWSTNGSNYSASINGGAALTVANGGILVSAGADDGRWINLITLRNNICIGAFKTSAAIVVPTITYNIDYVNWNDTHKWILTGAGNRVFDIIGGVHLTWTGTSHQSYDINASTLLLDSGYSRWIKTATVDEIVPYNAGSPLDVATYLGATYSKQTDHPGSATKHNRAPSLIDFDYLDATPAALAVMDRSNVTYQTAASRAASDYDATQVYRYEVSNIADPRIFMTFFNVGYKGRFYGKITVSSNHVMTFFGGLVTATDRTNYHQANAMDYCGSFVLAEYPNGSFSVDANDYVEFHDIAYSDDFGTSAAKTAYQNSAIINPLVTGGAYRKVVIGSLGTDNYFISQPICPNNCDIDVKCHLEMMNSVTDVLAADIVKTATSFTATDASKFHTGEFCVVTDDGQLFSYDVYRGWGGKITGIVGNVITLDTAAPYDYDASNNGRIATKASVILIDTASHVKVDVLDGGYIDGNQANQAKIHPTYWYGGNEVEVLRMGMGIAVWKSSYITLTDNVDVRNGSIHGVSFASDGISAPNQYNTIGNIHISDCEQKGLNLKYCKYGTMGNVTAARCRFEDGIIFYTTNSYWTCGDLTVTDCGRTGFNWNANNHDIVVNKITTSGCVANGVDIGSKNLTITVGIFTSDSIRFNQANPAGGGVSNVNIATIDIDACIKGLTTGIVWFYGGVKTVTIGTLTLNGCTGVGVKASVLSGLYPDDIRVNNGGIYTHTGTKTDIAVGSDVILTGDFT